jgi:hypothetical protein
MYICLEYYMRFYIIHKFEMYVHILYGIKYMITTKFLYEGFDNVFMFPNV